MWVVVIHYYTLFPMGMVLFIPGKGRRTFKKPECRMTFGTVKHSIYESGTGAWCERPWCARRDFVKIALPCSLKAIRSISHVAHATFIRFHSTLRHPEIKDEVNFWIVCQRGNRSSIYSRICKLYFAILPSLKNCSHNRT